MKLGFISDIHYDINVKVHSDILIALSEVIKEQGFDVVVIAGDLSSWSEQSLWIMDYLENKTNCKIYFIPGNHDIYSKTDSWIEYETLSSDERCLSGRPIKLSEDYMLFGDLFWYDYTYNLGYDLQQIKKKQFGATTWSDKKFAKWGLDDEDVNEYFLEKMKVLFKHFNSYKKIVVTHTVPFQEFVQVKNDHSWNFFNSFMGSEKIGELLLENQVDYSICGHTHKRQEMKVEGLQSYCVPLGYVGEWTQEYSPKLEIEKTFRTIII